MQSCCIKNKVQYAGTKVENKDLSVSNVAVETVGL